MSKYYNSQRNKNLYDSNSKESFKLSRSKIDLFLECPRCFYFDRRLGVGRPPGFPFTLNIAVDALLKKEFDVHRIQKQAHPLMKHYKIDAVRFGHNQINKWRNNYVGVQFLHKPTNLLIFGAIDDVWINKERELIVVDYKATSKSGKLSLNESWHESWKKQMEIYQWLFRQNRFKVSDTGYFVYVNALKDKKAFDRKLEFDVEILPYKGNDSWIGKIIFDIYKCLNSSEIPKANSDCDYCNYIKAITKTI